MQEIWGERMRKGKRIVELMCTFPHQNQDRCVVLPVLPHTLFARRSEIPDGLGRHSQMPGRGVNCAGMPTSPGDGPGHGRPMGNSRASDPLHSSQPGELLMLPYIFPLLLLCSCSTLHPISQLCESLLFP